MGVRDAAEAASWRCRDAGHRLDRDRRPAVREVIAARRG
jgi:hypothetical protein